MAYDFNNDGLTVPVVEHPNNVGAFAHDLRVIVNGGGSTILRKGIEEDAPVRTSSGLRRYLFYVSYAALTALGSGRTFGIAVRTITGDNGIGDWAVMPDAFNPPPPAPVLTYTATVNSATVYINRPAGLPRDYKCSVVHISSDPNYDPATGTPTHAEWNGDVIPVPCPDAAIKYVWIADQDSFGPSGLLYSARLAVQRFDPSTLVDLSVLEGQLDDAKQDLLDATDTNGANWMAYASNLVTGAIAGVRTDVTAVASDLEAETSSRTVAISTLGNSTSASIQTLTTKTTAMETSANASNLLISQHGDKLALHDTSLTTNANAISAETTARTLLATQVGNNQTALSTETTARTTADSALGTRIDTLSGVVGNNTAAIQTNAQVQVDNNAAQATLITGLTTRVGGNESAISSEATTRTNADSALGVRIDTLTSTVSGNYSALQQVDQTNANATSAVAGRTLTLEAQVAGTQGSAILTKITDEATARSTAVGGVASRAATLEAQMAGTQGSQLSATISQVNTVAVNAQNGVNNALAQSSLVLNANGQITGYKATAGAGTSEFQILASTFKIVDPNNGNTKIAPFEVSGGVIYMNANTVWRSGPSGVRTEQNANGTRVYDGNGTLRVRLGIW